MNFDDRLSQHLSKQAESIEVQPESITVVSGRARRRKQRNVGAIATLAIVGIFGFVVAAWQATAPSLSETATNGVADSVAATASMTTDAASSDGQDTPSAVWGVDGLDLQTVVPAQGQALATTSTNSTNAPGGYNVWQNTVSNGVYFILSTAPGVTWDEPDFETIRNDTLYTFTEDGWTQNTFGDRFVSTMGSGGGLLYAVSTGTTSARDFAVGTSANAGTSWDWIPVDLTEQFGADQSNWPWFSTTIAQRDGQLLVVVEKHVGPDWDQAVALAKQAGLEFDESDEVMFVDETSISIGRGFNEQTPCQAARDDYFNNAWSSFEDDQGPFGTELGLDGEGITPEMEAELEAWDLEMQQRMADVETGLLDHMRTIEGCDEFIACHVLELDSREILMERERAVMEEFGLPPSTGFVPVPPTIVELEDDQNQAFEAAMSKIYEGENWLDGSPECGPILYGPSFQLGEIDGPPGDTYTWAELGVTIPESWAGSRWGYLVEDGRSTSLGQLWNKNGFLVDLQHRGGQWVAQVDETVNPSAPWDAEQPNVEFQPVIATYRSSDAITWERTESNGFFFGLASVGEFNFGIDWEDGETSSLARISGQSGERLLLADLAPELDTEGYFLSDVRSGDFGVVAWASKWNERSGAPAGSILLYSPDGLAWGATLLESSEITDVIVGEEDTMIFTRTHDDTNNILLAR